LIAVTVTYAEALYVTRHVLETGLIEWVSEYAVKGYTMHSRQCGFLTKPRSDAIDDTFVCFFDARLQSKIVKTLV